jgi:hypothetical protein
MRAAWARTGKALSAVIRRREGIFSTIDFEYSLRLLQKQVAGPKSDSVTGRLGRVKAERRSPGGCPVRYNSLVAPLNLFGLFAVSLMLIFYVLEERSPRYVLGFAAACALGSVYGFLQGAWPFGVVEAIWSLVALRRWRSR